VKAATPAPSTTTTAPAITPMRPPPQVALPASSGSGAAGLLQTIFALLLVLGLLIGLAWLLKRYGPKPGGGLANLRVVGALNIGGRERIMVVEVGDQWIVVGAAPGRVNALHTMPRQDVDLGAGTGAAQGSIPATRFADWLKNTMDKRNAS
jgi:flagellar protein FliO/FliZ